MSQKIMPGIPVVIDGPNFINRVLDCDVDHAIVAEQLILTGVRRSLDEGIRRNTLAPASCDAAVEFVCSKRLFGPSSNKFTNDERQILIDRFMREVGVHVDEIHLPGKEEKGVDGEVQARLETLATAGEYVVLVAADRDYVPVLRKLRKAKCRVLVASLQKDFPKEIANEAWGVVDLRPHFNGLFSYAYPRYDAATLSLAQARSLISNADDRQHNQVRINDDGTVYLSRHPAIGNRERDDVKCQFETFVAGNDYVGPRAASDIKYVAERHKEITVAWRSGAHGHV